jgi:hypothetical protein
MAHIVTHSTGCADCSGRRREPCAYVACRPSDTLSRRCSCKSGARGGSISGLNPWCVSPLGESGRRARSRRGPFSAVVDRRRSRAAPPGLAHPCARRGPAPGPAADRQRADSGSGRRRCRHDQNDTVTDDDSVRPLIVSTRLLGTREIMTSNHGRLRDVSRDIRVLPLPGGLSAAAQVRPARRWAGADVRIGGRYRRVEQG